MYSSGMLPTACCCGSRVARSMRGIAEAMLRLRPDVAEREPHLLAWHCSEAGQVELADGLLAAGG